jgi:hypothetical protein
LIGFAVFQLGIRVGGRLLARRLNSGDETSSQLRRVQTMGQVSLRPTSHELSRLRFDLAFAGLDLDLTQARPAPGGTDILLNCAFGGGNVRVPAGWTIASDSRGVGAVAAKGDGGAPGAHAATAADVRIHLRALFGGVTVKQSRESLVA